MGFPVKSFPHKHWFICGIIGFLFLGIGAFVAMGLFFAKRSEYRGKLKEYLGSDDFTKKTEGFDNVTDYLDSLDNNVRFSLSNTEYAMVVKSFSEKKPSTSDNHSPIILQSHQQAPSSPLILQVQLPKNGPPVIEINVSTGGRQECSLISSILGASRNLSSRERKYFEFLLVCNVGLNYGRDDFTNFHFDNTRLVALNQKSPPLYDSIMKMLKNPNNNLFLNIAEMFNLFDTMQRTLLGASYSYPIINILSLNISLTLVTKYIQSNPAIYTPPVCQQRLKKILFTILTDKNFINDISKKFVCRNMQPPTISNPPFEEIIVFEVFIMVFKNLNNNSNLPPNEMQNLLEKFSISEHFWSFYTPCENFDNEMSLASRAGTNLARRDIINAAIDACVRHSELGFKPQPPYPMVEERFNDIKEGKEASPSNIESTTTSTSTTTTSTSTSSVSDQSSGNCSHPSPLKPITPQTQLQEQSNVGSTTTSTSTKTTSTTTSSVSCHGSGNCTEKEKKRVARIKKGSRLQLPSLPKEGPPKGLPMMSAAGVPKFMENFKKLKGVSGLEKPYFVFLLICNYQKSESSFDHDSYAFDNKHISDLVKYKKHTDQIIPMLQDPNNKLFFNIAEMFYLLMAMYETIRYLNYFNVLSLNISLTLAVEVIKSKFKGSDTYLKFKKILFTILTDEDFITELSKKVEDRAKSFRCSSSCLGSAKCEEFIVFEVFYIVFTNLINSGASISQEEMETLISAFGGLSNLVSPLYRDVEHSLDDYVEASRGSLGVNRREVMVAVHNACERHPDLGFTTLLPQKTQLQEQSSVESTTTSTTTTSSSNQQYKPTPSTSGSSNNKQPVASTSSSQDQDKSETEKEIVATVGETTSPVAVISSISSIFLFGCIQGVFDGSKRALVDPEKVSSVDYNIKNLEKNSLTLVELAGEILKTRFYVPDIKVTDISKQTNLMRDYHVMAGLIPGARKFKFFNDQTRRKVVLKTDKDLKDSGTLDFVVKDKTQEEANELLGSGKLKVQIVPPVKNGAEKSFSINVTIINPSAGVEDIKFEAERRLCWRYNNP